MIILLFLKKKNRIDDCSQLQKFFAIMYEKLQASLISSAMYIWNKASKTEKGNFLYQATLEKGEEKKRNTREFQPPVISLPEINPQINIQTRNNTHAHTWNVHDK